MSELIFEGAGSIKVGALTDGVRDGVAVSAPPEEKKEISTENLFDMKIK